LVGWLVEGLKKDTVSMQNEESKGIAAWVASIQGESLRGKNYSLCVFERVNWDGPIPELVADLLYIALFFKKKISTLR
jgi:hypothetical protein